MASDDQASPKEQRFCWYGNTQTCSNEVALRAPANTHDRVCVIMKGSSLLVLPPVCRAVPHLQCNEATFHSSHAASSACYVL